MFNPPGPPVPPLDLNSTSKSSHYETGVQEDTTLQEGRLSENKQAAYVSERKNTGGLPSNSAEAPLTKSIKHKKGRKGRRRDRDPDSAGAVGSADIPREGISAVDTPGTAVGVALDGEGTPSEVDESLPPPGTVSTSVPS